MFACAKQLAAANRLQKYKNFPTYTNFYEEKFRFFVHLRQKLTFAPHIFRYVPLCGCKGITIF